MKLFPVHSPAVASVPRFGVQKQYSNDSLKDLYALHDAHPHLSSRQIATDVAAFRKARGKEDTVGMLNAEAVAELRRIPPNERPMAESRNPLPPLTSLLASVTEQLNPFQAHALTPPVRRYVPSDEELAFDATFRAMVVPWGQGRKIKLNSEPVFQKALNTFRAQYPQATLTDDAARRTFNGAFTVGERRITLRPMTEFSSTAW